MSAPFKRREQAELGPGTVEHRRRSDIVSSAGGEAQRGIQQRKGGQNQVESARTRTSHFCDDSDWSVCRSCLHHRRPVGEANQAPAVCVAVSSCYRTFASIARVREGVCASQGDVERSAGPCAPCACKFSVQHFPPSTSATQSVVSKQRIGRCGCREREGTWPAPRALAVDWRCSPPTTGSAQTGSRKRNNVASCRRS